MDDLASYLATLPNGMARLKANPEAIGPQQSNISPLKAPFLDLAGAHILDILWMPYAGSRPRDKIMASAIAHGSTVLDIVKALNGGIDSFDGVVAQARNLLSSVGFPRNGIFEDFNWHHNEIVGVMQSVDESSHRKNHIGGVKFYEIITNKGYGSK